MFTSLKVLWSRACEHGSTESCTPFIQTLLVHLTAHSFTVKTHRNTGFNTLCCLIDFQDEISRDLTENVTIANKSAVVKSRLELLLVFIRFKNTKRLSLLPHIITVS